MLIIDLIKDPLFPFSDNWGFYLIIYYLAILYSDSKEKAEKRKLDKLSRNAHTVADFCCHQVLVNNTTNENRPQIYILAERVHHSLLRAERARSQRHISLI